MTSTSPSVEHGIPIPPKRGGYYKYRWDSMAVGDSFLVPRGTTLSTISSVANRAGKRLKRTFSCRTTGKRIRVWRTA